jgi:hypothetical protein
VRTGSTVPEEVAPLVKAVGKYAKPTSLVVSAVAADTLALANYGFTKAGKVDSKAAANALAKIGADSDYPAEDFWVFRHANPAYHGTVHSPLDADLSNGFFSVAHPGETVGGTYPGKPLTF